jgi:UDP-N-acetylmuramoyl-tripeptide--D-alanyl-D-alanine ligase
MIESFKYYSATVRAIFEPFKHLEKENKPIEFITTSSSEVVPRTLFVPLRGNRDGHEFILDALSKGAEFFLCEKNHPILNSLTPKQLEGAILVDDTLLALGKLATFHRNRFNPVVIAITGSSGKTTTKEFFRACLSYFGEGLVVTEKNYNNEIGVPFTLFRINEKTKIVVCEMGMNHRWEISRLSKMSSPDISLITNIGSAHIENLGSVEEIARAKMEIVDGMTSGKLYVPQEFFTGEQDVLSQSEREQLLNQGKWESIPFSLEKNEQLFIEEERADGFRLKLLGQTLNWAFPSKKLLYNLSGVLLVLDQLGLDHEKIFQGISKFQFGDKRNVLHSNYFRILDDTYNANPESMKASIETIRQMSEGKDCYAILGDMKELGKFSEKYHREVGKYCASLKITGIFTYGKDAEMILDSYLQNYPNGKGKHFLMNDFSIINFVKSECKEGSFVLVKGSRSMKMEEIVERIKNL